MYENLTVNHSEKLPSFIAKSAKVLLLKQLCKKILDTLYLSYGHGAGPGHSEVSASYRTGNIFLFFGDGICQSGQ